MSNGTTKTTYAMAQNASTADVVVWEREHIAVKRNAKPDKSEADYDGDWAKQTNSNQRLRLVPFLRRYWILHLSVAAGLVFLLNLSLWQFGRLDQKLALIERAQVRVNEPAIAAPGPADWENLTSDEIDYLPIQAAGQFILGELFYFDTLTKPKGSIGGQGYFVYSPFITEDGWIILVNRGFIPRAKKQFSTRLGSAAPRGPITISGLARRAEIPSTFSASANAETGEWFVREPRPMAEALGLNPESVAPYTLDLQETLAVAGSLPQAGETRMSFTNNHLQYAYTWAGLALTLLGVYLAFLIKAWRENRLKPVAVEENEDELD